MALDLRFTPKAEHDLNAIAQWVASAAGREIAVAYIERIRDRCRSLRDFPSRGSPRDEGGMIRSVSFERRATIVYRVEPGGIVILGIFHAGREIGVD